MQIFLIPFLITLMLSLWGRTRFQKIYSEESRHLVSSGITGAELVRRVLVVKGIEGVAIRESRGVVPDGYDPVSRTVRLAPQHFGGSTYSALAIAALQAGKAIQAHEKHRPLLWRQAAVMWTVYLSVPLMVAALFAVLLGMNKTVLPMLLLGWALIAGWNLLTVPTELDAGERVKKLFPEIGAFRNFDERAGVQRVLGAASTSHVEGVSVLGSWLAGWLRWGRGAAGEEDE